MNGYRAKIYFVTYIELEPCAENEDDALLRARDEAQDFLANHIPWSFEDHRMVQMIDNLRPWKDADEVEVAS